MLMQLTLICDVMKPYELGCEMQKKRTECSIMIQAKLMLESNN